MLAAVLAAAGPEVVPAEGRGGDPGWLLGPFGEGFGVEGDDYLGLERWALILWIAVLALATAIPARLLAAGCAAALGLFTLAPPLLSLDAFSYASYARLETLHGLNPYEFAPDAVPGDEAVAFVEDWRGTVSVYGPLFTLVTLPLAHLGLAGSVWSLKALAGICVAGVAWLCARAAPARGLDPRPVAALIALNPLVLVHVVGGAHNDALMALLVTAGLVALIGGRELSGGRDFVAAAAVKTSALFALPFVLAGNLRSRRIWIGAAVAAAVAVLLSLAIFGEQVGEAISVASANQDNPSRSSLPSTISTELGLDLDTVRVVLLVLCALLAAALLAWVVRGADWVRAAGWAGLGVLAASSYVAPWYAIWPLPFAALSRDRALVVGTVVLTAFLLRHQVPGLGG